MPERTLDRLSSMPGLRGLAPLLALGLAAGVVLAQDQTGDETALDPIATEGAPIKAVASEPAPRAARSLLMDVVNTGRRIVAVGDRGTIVISSNGQDWAQVATPINTALTAVVFANENDGWAVGHDATILHTTDGGRSWALQNFEPELEKPFLDVFFVDDQTGYALGAYGLFYGTTDGGDRWAPVDAPVVNEEELHLNVITRLNDGSLFVLGETGLMAVSADASRWQKIPSPYEGSLFGALPVGPRGVLVVGLRGNAFLSRDVRGGEWQRIDTGTQQTLMSSTDLPDGRVAIAGIGGTLLVMSPDGSIEQVPLRIETGLTGSGSLSSVIPWPGGVLVVGETGTLTVAVK